MRNKVIGIILAGGKSSRMGENKALMEYQGHCLLNLMAAKLTVSGIHEIRISGNIEGYDCIADKSTHAGPACAIIDILSELQGDYDAALFVPVDTPLITPEQLQKMMSYAGGSFYQGHFLPALIPLEAFKAVENQASFKQAENMPVKKLLSYLKLEPIALAEGEEADFLNVNTPEKYRELLSRP